MIQISADGTQLDCDGRWTLPHIAALHELLSELSDKLGAIKKVNVLAVTKMDTAGALFLSDLMDRLHQSDESVELSGLKNKFQSLFSLVSRETAHLQTVPSSEPATYNLFAVLGRWAVDKYLQLLAFLAFLGELFVITLQNVLSPQRVQWKSTFKIIDETGYRALPIVGLMAFLIGVVLAYQLTTELRVYGATVFVVEVSGIAILREFGPLITAIIMAGRTSTSFAALIGTMKVNEEIDALSTMGISPLERLVLPRIFGLIIVLPLLTIWADIFGVCGSMLMSHWTIDISLLGYLERFQEVVPLKHLMLGLVKTPVFAMIISAVGCFQGFQVGSSADSVGWKTTKSAVQSIFLIIVADAAFSILFSMMGV